MNILKNQIFVSIYFCIALIFVLSVNTFASEETTTLKDVKSETKEAIEAIKNYSESQRDETVKQVKLLIDQLDTKIKQLETKIENQWNQMDQAARTKAKATLEQLRKQRNSLAEWYGGLKHSSVKAWEEVKDGFIKSYHTLENSFNEAAKEF